MPISSVSSSVLIPFVNGLEEKTQSLSVQLEDWSKNKNKVLSMASDLSTINYRVTTAIAQSSNALSEIANATVSVNATSPNKLRVLIDNLRKEMVAIAEATEGLGTGGGGGAGAYDERINAEIDNALASVDETVPEGLKLDYRLRQLQETALNGGSAGAMKDVVFPYKHDSLSRITSFSYALPEDDTIIYKEGIVTVLDMELNPIYTSTGVQITAEVDEFGVVQFNEPPGKRVQLYYPVEMQFKDTPKEFLMVFLDLVLTKNSELYKSIASINEEMGDIAEVLRSMQGKDWTNEYSIMRNHQEIIREAITPRGLNISVDGENVHMNFSFSDHEHLSHFIGEVYNEATGQWEPYNGTDGIISK